MFSGKSTELIRLINRYHSIGKKVLVVNHSMDNRYSDNPVVVSHSGTEIPGVKVKHLMDLKTMNLEQPDVIAIDEAQFFDDLKERVMYFVEELEITVIVAGLSSDYQRNPFGHVLDLIPLCDKVWMAAAYCSRCKDGTKAIFTKRITDEEEQTIVGDDKKYMAVCRSCYISSP